MKMTTKAEKDFIAVMRASSKRVSFEFMLEAIERERGTFKTPAGVAMKQVECNCIITLGCEVHDANPAKKKTKKAKVK